VFAPFGHAGGDGGIAGGTEEGFGLVEGCGVYEALEEFWWGGDGRKSDWTKREVRIGISGSIQ